MYFANLSLWKAEVGGIQVQTFQASLAYAVRTPPPHLKKGIKIQVKVRVLSLVTVFQILVEGSLIQVPVLNNKRSVHKESQGLKL